MMESERTNYDLSKEIYYTEEEEKEFNFNEELNDEPKYEKLSEEKTRKIDKKYRYLSKIQEKPAYSKNLSDEEAEKFEVFLVRMCYSYWICNEVLRAHTTVEDLHSEIVLRLLEKATVPGKKCGRTRIAGNYGLLVAYAKNCMRDYYRSTRLYLGKENPNVTLSEYNASGEYTGDEVAYRYSESAREEMDNYDVSEEMDLNNLIDVLLDEKTYAKFELKPKMLENVRKYVVFKAYHANINNLKIMNLYREYESELDEEKKELIAESEAERRQMAMRYGADKINPGLSSDVMLKSFYGIRSGISAGSARKIVAGIPQILSEVIHEVCPECRFIQ